MYIDWPLYPNNLLFLYREFYEDFHNSIIMSLCLYLYKLVNNHVLDMNDYALGIYGISTNGYA